MSAQQPIDTVRIGAIEAAIWQNTSPKGYLLYNTTIVRRYDDEHGNPQSSHSFSRDELLVVGKVCDLAHTRILNRMAEDRKRQKETEAANQPATQAGRSR